MKVHIVELTLKLSPVPLSVERKEARDAEALYQKILNCMEHQRPRLIELTCEKLEDKKVTVLLEEIIAVQIYEKTATMGGSKRPGFSFQE